MTKIFGDPFGRIEGSEVDIESSGFNQNLSPTENTAKKAFDKLDLLDPTIRFTPEGGLAILLMNKTGVNSVKGTVIYAGTVEEESYIIAPAGGDSAIGIVYESGVIDGDFGWVVVSGMAMVLLEDNTTSERGYWARTSTTQAGRADITNPDPPSGGIILELDEHMEEIGHCLQDITAGTDKLSKIVLHFN